MQMKASTDRKKVVKTSDIQVGDSVVVRQGASSNAMPPFQDKPLKGQYQNGTQVVAKRKDGTITITYHYEENSTCQENTLSVPKGGLQVYANGRSTSQTSTWTVCYQTRSSEQSLSLNICCVTSLSAFTLTTFCAWRECSITIDRDWQLM